MAGSAGRDTVGGAVGLSEAVEEPATGSGQLAGLRLAVDKTRPTPAYLQLSEQLTRSIEEGDLVAGSALPSERVLALDLGLSRMTVRRAFEELVAAGVVEQRQGSGTFVRPRPLEQVIDRVLGFTDEARNLGFEPGSRLLSTQRLPADDHVAQALRVPSRTEVLQITRLRTATDEPLALQDAHLAPRLAELSLELLEETGSLYSTLDKQFGIKPARARQTIAARLPTDHECRLLGIGKLVPVLALERTTYGEDGLPFEYVRSAYRGDIYRMALDLRAF